MDYPGRLNVFLRTFISEEGCTPREASHGGCS